MDQLLAAPSGVLVVDLSDVTFLASSGLAVLIRAAHRADDRRLRIVATARAVRRPLEITGSTSCSTSTTIVAPHSHPAGLNRCCGG